MTDTANTPDFVPVFEELDADEQAAIAKTKGGAA